MRILLSLFLPPAAILGYTQKNTFMHLVINIVLCILTWGIGGVIHALAVTNDPLTREEAIELKIRKEMRDAELEAEIRERLEREKNEDNA